MVLVPRPRGGSARLLGQGSGRRGAARAVATRHQPAGEDQVVGRGLVGHLDPDPGDAGQGALHPGRRAVTLDVDDLVGESRSGRAPRRAAPPGCSSSDRSPARSPGSSRRPEEIRASSVSSKPAPASTSSHSGGDPRLLRGRQDDRRAVADDAEPVARAEGPGWHRRSRPCPPASVRDSRAGARSRSRLSD